MPNTTQYGIISTIVIPLANTALGVICGHSVDITSVSLVAEFAAIATTIGGFLTEHLNLGQPAPTPATK